jgi:hypothetical protein
MSNAGKAWDTYHDSILGCGVTWDESEGFVRWLCLVVVFCPFWWYEQYHWFCYGPCEYHHMSWYLPTFPFSYIQYKTDIELVAISTQWILMILEICSGQSLLSLREEWLAEAKLQAPSQNGSQNGHHHTMLPSFYSELLHVSKPLGKNGWWPKMTWFYIFLYCLQRLLNAPAPFLVIWHDPLMCWLTLRGDI